MIGRTRIGKFPLFFFQLPVIYNPGKSTTWYGPQDMGRRISYDKTNARTTVPEWIRIPPQSGEAMVFDPGSVVDVCLLEGEADTGYPIDRVNPVNDPYVTAH